MTCPPLVNMRLLVELFPQFNSMSIYRWNTAKAKRNRLPDPDLVVGDVALWEVDTILAWAGERGIVPDVDTLEKICQSQVL